MLLTLAVAFDPAIPLTGTVEDRTGRPVAGAVVWLGDTNATRDGPQVLATGITDSRGRFRLERAAGLAGRGTTWSPTLWAYSPGLRVAFLEFKARLPAAGDSVHLVLGPPAAAALRVLRPDGTPAIGVRVCLVDTCLEAPRPPDGLIEKLAVTTDALGRCTIDGFAQTDIEAVDVTARGQLVQCLPIDPVTGTVTLRPLGRLTVQVIADDPAALAGWKITLWSQATEPGESGPASTQWCKSPPGRTAVPASRRWPPAGSSGRSSPPPRRTTWSRSCRGRPSARRRPRPWRSRPCAVRVEGTVVEEPGGVPVAGVTVEVNSLKHLTGAAHLVVTDAHGRFSTAVLPGPARFSFWADRMPKTHFLPPNIPDWVDFQVPEGARRQEFNPPRLHRAEQVRGRVVDEAGKPVPGAVVAGTWISGEFGANPNSIRVQSDAHGDFVLGSIAPRSKVELSASTGLTAESEPLTVLSPAADQRVSLVLRMRPTLALDGRVLGTDGRPLADAVIHVMIRPANQPFHLVNEFAFFRAGPIRTDRAGRYRTPDQIPMDCDYRVAARAPGYEPGESPWVTAPRTEVPDVKLRPAPALRMLTGQVVDSSGKPLTGAEVYQSGDGPRKTRGSTGSDGRYRVAGVAGTPAFLFVAKEGYHFVGRLVEPADHSADFTLRRLDEPSGTVLHQAARPLGREEEHHHRPGPDRRDAQGMRQ